MAKFQKGQSGNPAGRKAGTGYANKLRQGIESDLPEIIGALVNSAKTGDTAAAKILLDRSLPALKPIQTATTIENLDGKTLSEQGTAIVRAMGTGQLTPEQAQQMLAGVASLSKIIEVNDLMTRIEKLESNQDDD